MKKSVLQNIKSAFNLSYLALIVLFCFAISTSFMTINYMAKYSSTSSGGNGARVAKFEVELNSPTAQMTFDASSYGGKSQTQTHSFSLESKSDVSVKYSIKVSFGTTPPPAQLKLWIDDEERARIGDGTTTDFIFADYTYNIGDEKKTHTLNISLEYAGDSGDNDFTNTKLDDVTISVIAEQID